MFSDLPPPSHYESIVEKGPLEDSNRVKQKAYQVMSQLEGWCTLHKASVLIDFVLIMQPRQIVEIGVFGGKSLVPMALALQENGLGRIYGVDPWDSAESVVGMDGVNEQWWGTLNHQKILDGLVQKINENDLTPYVTLLRTTSENAPSIPNIDMLHVDGNHGEMTALLDVTKWVPLVRSGGLVIFDDIKWATTGSAIDWLNENCIPLALMSEDNGWGIWVKP